VLDAVGAGELPDAAQYGDEGSNTLGNVARAVGGLDLPSLEALGLGNVEPLEGCPPQPGAPAVAGRLFERSKGKDTTTGHWELAGLTLAQPFPTYPDGFPQPLIDEIEREIGMGVIGNCAASGTEIIERLGSEHLRSGKPIVDTSADSVFQVAAHEAIIPPSELWHICRVARRVLTGDYAVGRVIARPFVGNPGAFERTGNRKDFSLDPTGRTVLDLIKESGRDVIGVGKIEDIFNFRGLTSSNHAVGNEACVDAVIDALRKPRMSGLVFANLGDTDMLYGHRRDAEGFARALEAFDRRLPEIMRMLGEDGLLIVTADHGCDPTHAGTDHTREYVPVLAWSLAAAEGVDLGTRKSFAVVAATALEALGVKNTLGGASCWTHMTL
jgi:phosphopentomutase